MDTAVVVELVEEAIEAEGIVVLSTRSGGGSRTSRCGWRCSGARRSRRRC
jgi:hypothetical protein